MYTPVQNDDAIISLTHGVQSVCLCGCVCVVCLHGMQYVCVCVSDVLCAVCRISCVVCV